MTQADIYLREDTIASASTAAGRGAVAVIRVSGPLAVAVCRSVFRRADRKSELKARVMHFGSIVDPQNGERIDDVLCVAFYAPSSYNGEDLVEFHCHGSDAVVRRVLELLYSSGARPAEPGEFTFRAVRNGKMDLAQAEGVAALIDSRSQLARSLSLRMLEGAFSADLAQLKAGLVTVVVEVETQIEFPDDAMEESICLDLEKRFDALVDGITAVKKRAVREQRFEQGVLTVLAGRPNVGKSSLFNRLLGRERAIVSPHPGTTRDSIEGTIELQGRPVTLIDTAGLRETQEEIEAIGIERSRQVLTTSHVILFLFDASVGLTDEERKLLDDVSRFSADSKIILVANKTDLAGHISKNGFAYPVVFSSAAQADGLDELIETLEREVAALVPADGESSYMVSARQERLLVECVETLTRVAQWMKERAPMELLAEELRVVLRLVSELDGSDAPPDIMSTIFSTFCIGK